MPITTIDPKTALIVVDLQNGIIAAPMVHPTEGVVKNAVALVDAFRARGLPIVLINVDKAAPGRTEQARPPQEFPARWTDLIPQLDRQPEDHVVTKRTWGAFTHTDLNAYLKNAGVTQVVVVGISTSAGVESTARQAYEHGFNVTLAVDAMTDRDAEVHANSVTRIFPKLGETGTTAEIVALLAAA
jgi:nicotinamidase-related amidase